MVKRKGRRRKTFRGQIVQLSAKKLVEAFFEELSSSFYPKGKNPPVSPLTFGNGKQRKMRSASSLWNSMGQLVVLTKSGKSGLAVRVPSLVDVLVQVNERNRLSTPKWKKFIAVANANCSEPLTVLPKKMESDSRLQIFADAVDPISLLAYFEQLTAVDQIQTINLVRESLVRDIVSICLNWVFQNQIKFVLEDQSIAERKAQSFIDLPESLPHLENFDLETPLAPQFTKGEPIDETYVQGVLGGIAQFDNHQRLRFLQKEMALKRECLPPMLAIIDTFYWEERIAPTRGVEEFLPRGMPAIQESSDGSSSYNDALGISQLELSDEQVLPERSKIDPERLSFYTRVLGCKKIVKPVGKFLEHGYEAFLLRGKSGERFALLDCERISNAVYVFCIDTAATVDDAQWLLEAQRPKSQVLSRQGAGTPFVRRIFHSKNWQERVQQFLLDN